MLPDDPRALRDRHRAVFVAVVYVGCVAKLDVCWTLSDIFNGLMALPNLVALLCLSPLVAKETRAYVEARKKRAKDVEDL